jgi:enoyl-[acyl-carrier protein] reductase II
MIRTPICDLLGIDHPICLGGMGSGTNPELVSAVSNAGGLGALGCHGLRPEQVDERTASIRRQTNKPFGLNFLMFHAREDSFAAALALRPAVMQFAWAKPEQDLRGYFERSHQAGCLVTYMAGNVAEATRGESRRRHPHCPGHRGRRPRRLDGQHAAHPDGGRCGRAHSGAGGGRIC